MNGKFRKVAATALIFWVAVAAVALIGKGLQGWSSDTPQAHIPGPSSTPSATACASTWAMAKETPENGNWVAGGVPSIKSAKTKAEARAAATDWVNGVKEQPGTLQGAAGYLLHKQVKISALRGEDGCATEEAKSLVNELSVAIAMSDISAGQAPTNGWNSGTRDGETYVYGESGVSGDRSAIRLVSATGDTVWIMARCGNPVTHHHPTPTPTPTPTQPTPTPRPTCPPSMPHGTWPLCKDDPTNQPPGNNPDGNQPGGHNDTDGPGSPNPEPTFQNTPYVPPSTPEPTQTPRPEPTQPPATGAPDPTEAPTTCVPPPGKTTC